MKSRFPTISSPSNVFSRIQVVVGDIAEQPYVDVIVNAANETLLGGGGVDGAIHHGAGLDLLKTCRALGGCEPGQVKWTPAFNLKAKIVVHAVGPRWRGGDHGEPALLANCYQRALEVAKEHGLRTVAFPAISTGAFRYPLKKATAIAVREVLSSLEVQPDLEVRFVCFDQKTATGYRDELNAAKISAEVAVPMAYLARAQKGEPLDVVAQSLLAAGDQDALPELLALFYEWGKTDGGGAK